MKRATRSFHCPSSMLDRAEYTTLKASADQNPPTVNPSIQSLASSTTPALMTKRKSPNEKTVRGIVKSTSSGLTVLLSKAKTTDNQMAVVNLSRSTLGRIQAVPNAANVRAMRRTPHEGRLGTFMVAKVQRSYHALKLSPQGIAQGLNPHELCQFGLTRFGVGQRRKLGHRFANSVFEAVLLEA